MYEQVECLYGWKKHCMSIISFNILYKYALLYLLSLSTCSHYHNMQILMSVPMVLPTVVLMLTASIPLAALIAFAGLVSVSKEL